MAAGGGDEELTLLGAWASPFVMRARMALNLKGLTYAYSEENLDDKSERLVTSNPVFKKVPVLIHRGKPVCESRIIVEYVDEAFPSPAAAFLPPDAYDRAVARFWAAYVDDKLYSAWAPVFRGRTAEDRAEAARRAVAALETLEGAFRESSGDGKKAFFGGDAVGLVDVVLGGLVGWLYATEALCGVNVVDAGRTPLLAAWADRFCKLEGVKEVIPDVDRLVEYTKARRTHFGLPPST